MNKKPTPENRIWFKDNPWPDGHGLKEVRFYGLLREDGVYLHLEIKSENYYAKEGYENLQDIADEHDEILEKKGIEDEWKYYGGWLNFHACHIQPNKELLLGNEQHPFTIQTLPNLMLEADHPPPESETWGGISFDNLAFHCYILGHDAVGYHSIRSKSAKSPFSYNIDWHGKVALAYMGDEEFRYSFEIQLRDIPFEGFLVQTKQGYEYAESEEEDWYWSNMRREGINNKDREKELWGWLERHTTIERSQMKFVIEENSDWLRFL